MLGPMAKYGKFRANLTNEKAGQKWINQNNSVGNWACFDWIVFFWFVVVCSVWQKRGMGQSKLGIKNDAIGTVFSTPNQDLKA
jgi:hypothetical protein